MHSPTGVLRGRSLSSTPGEGFIYFGGCCHVQLYIKLVANKASNSEKSSQVELQHFHIKFSSSAKRFPTVFAMSNPSVSFQL